MPPKQKTRHVVRPSLVVKSEIPFFLSLIVIIILSLGMVIVAQKMAIAYLSREFPRVAEYNYQVLRADIAAMEQRMSGKIAEVQNVCQYIPRETSTLPLSPPAYQ